MLYNRDTPGDGLNALDSPAVFPEKATEDEDRIEEAAEATGTPVEDRGTAVCLFAEGISSNAFSTK